MSVLRKAMHSRINTASDTNGFSAAPIDGSAIPIMTREATARVPCLPVHSKGLRIVLGINVQKNPCRRIDIHGRALSCHICFNQTDDLSLIGKALPFNFVFGKDQPVIALHIEDAAASLD